MTMKHHKLGEAELLGERLGERNARRARMGLPPLGMQRKAITATAQTFTLSHHAFAQARGRAQ
jgi:hypothetical protein